MRSRARESGDRAFDLAGIADVGRADLYPKRWRHGLNHGELADPFRYSRIAQDDRARDARCDLFEQFQPFRSHPIFNLRKPGGISAWMRQVRDKTCGYRIGGLREYNRDGAGYL